MKKLVFFLVMIILAGGVFTACNNQAVSSSGGATAGDVQINDIWARPGQAGGSTAIYFNIKNQGGQAEHLIDVSCEAVMKAELHKTEQDANGNMKMVHQERIPLPAGETVAFAPGGLHVMLMNLKNDLKAGETLSFTLHFENAGTVTLEAPVREP